MGTNIWCSLKLDGNRELIIEKMIEKRIDNVTFPYKTLPSYPSAKENSVLIAPVTHVPKSPTRYIRTSFHQQEPPVQTQWGTSTTVRVVSPLSTISNSRRPDFIELGGGSREKREGSLRQGEQSRSVELSRDTLLRKIAALEGRIKEIHLQKQVAVGELNEKINKLQIQNDRLNVPLSNNKCKQTEKVDEFSGENLEEMLSAQININLELREENQRLNEQLKLQSQKCDQYYSKCSLLETEKDSLFGQYQTTLSNLEAQRQQTALHTEELNVKVAQMERKISETEQFRLKRERAIQEMSEDREKRILELEDEIYSLTSATEQKNNHLSQLQTELSSTRAHIQEVMSQKQQCKKCKELLHTVFRLNSQLNKK